MSITGKIRLGLGVLLAFFVLQFLLGQYVDRGTQAQVDTAITKNFAAADQLAELAVGGQQIRRYEKEFFIYANDEKGRAKYRKEWTDTHDKLEATVTKLSANEAKAYAPKDLTEIRKWRNALDFYSTEFNKIMVLADEGKLVAAEQAPVETKASAKFAPVAAPAPANSTKIANDMIGPGKDKFREMLDGATKMRKEKIAESATSVTEIGALFKRGAMISLGIFALGLIVAIYMMVSVPAAVKKPIEEFVALTDKISKGDTKNMIHADGAVEFAGLAKALERLRVAQAGLLEKIRGKTANF